MLSQVESRSLGGYRLLSICPMEDPGCVSEYELYASDQYYFKLALMRVVGQFAWCRSTGVLPVGTARMAVLR